MSETLSVDEAKEKGICRICGLPAERWMYDQAMVYNYGKEYAHRDCLDGKSESPYIGKEAVDALRAAVATLRAELSRVQPLLGEEDFTLVGEVLAGLPLTEKGN